MSLIINPAKTGGGSGTVTSISAGTGITLTPNPITTTGTVSLSNTAVTPGTYGDATHVGQFTVDQQGRLTFAGNVAISGAGLDTTAWHKGGDTVGATGVFGTIDNQDISIIINNAEVARAFSSGNQWQFGPSSGTTSQIFTFGSSAAANFSTSINVESGTGAGTSSAFGFFRNGNQRGRFDIDDTTTTLSYFTTFKTTGLFTQDTLSISNAGLAQHFLTNATTAAVDNVLVASHNSSGTPAVGFGTGVELQGKSSTTVNRTLAQIQARWTTATDASRTSILGFWTVNSGVAAEQMTLDATGHLTLGSPLAILYGGTGASTALAAFNNLSPLTTRGDLLTRDASNNVRLPVGGASTLLKSNGTDPSWGTVNLLSAFHGDTAAGTVVRGDVIVGNSTPAWARVAIGGANTVLHSDGTDATWQALANADIPNLTSAQWATHVTDETGTGLWVFNDSPTFTTRVIDPLLIGGTGASGTLQLQSTTNATRGTVNLVDQGLLWTALSTLSSAQNALDLSQNLTLNDPTSALTLLHAGGTWTNTDAAANFHSLLKSDVTLTNSGSPTIIPGIRIVSNLTTITAGVSGSQQTAVGFLDSPTFNVGAGTWNATSPTYDQYRATMAAASIGASSTRRGFRVVATTGGGVWGTEIGLDVAALTGTTAAAVQSAITAASTRYFLKDDGGAQSKFTGKITTYNNVATDGQGVSYVVKVIDLTTQGAAGSGVALFTPAASGFYRVSVTLTLTRVASGGSPSSTLGGAAGVKINYHTAEASTKNQQVPFWIPTSATATQINSSTNTSGDTLIGAIVIFTDTTAVTYDVGYTSAGTTPMQYALHIRVESL